MSNQLIKKAFVCGWPIEHSRSPIIHSYWLKKYGLDGTYEKIAVAPDHLQAFLNDMNTSGFVGGNFTIPHKENIRFSLFRIDVAAKAIGAVNTVWLENENLMMNKRKNISSSLGGVIYLIYFSSFRCVYFFTVPLDILLCFYS